MINTIIFDMDGVLIDSVGYHRKAFEEVFLKHGLKINKEDFKEVGGMTTREIFEKIAEKHERVMDVDAMTEEKDQKAFERISSDLIIFDGVSELINKLKEEGFRIGFATSSHKPVVDIFFDKSGLRDKFDSKVMGVDLHRSKPDPEVFLLAAERMRSVPEQCVVVEDGVQGIIAAHNAGMKCIGVNSRFIKPEDIEKADVIVESIKEITPEMIRNL